jgi:GNAT superfamily N-acetyltransferase
MSIAQWSAQDVRRHPADLVDLLIDTVDAGASVGFLPPLSASQAREYWSGVANALAGGGRRLLVYLEDERVLGTVQLDLAGMPNGSHRAEVMKLMVHPSARGRGIAAQLITAVEELARAEGRLLLVLDTRTGDTAEALYRKWGWIEAGRIPGYARSAAGTLDETVIFYKQLAS